MEGLRCLGGGPARSNVVIQGYNFGMFLAQTRKIPHQRQRRPSLCMGSLPAGIEVGIRLPPRQTPAVKRLFQMRRLRQRNQR